MKLKSYLSILLLILFSFQVNASVLDNNSKPDRKKIENMTTEEKKARLEEIKVRVNEIKDMDKSNLSREEKKALKEELKDMRQEARAVRGIYLSIGALIIIILLLIIIL